MLGLIASSYTVVVLSQHSAIGTNQHGAERLVTSF
jgi:hypothetical protein